MSDPLEFTVTLDGVQLNALVWDLVGEHAGKVADSVFEKSRFGTGEGRRLAEKAIMDSIHGMDFRERIRDKVETLAEEVIAEAVREFLKKHIARQLKNEADAGKLDIGRLAGFLHGKDGET